MGIISYFSYLIFPGIFFVVYISLTSIWVVRKLSARMENRVGPPFNQPLFDFAKIMAKERVYPMGASQGYMHMLPRLQVIIALLMSFFIPIYKEQPLISFEGDIYLFLFLLALHGSTVFFIGWASRNPYSLSGAGRALLTEISFELPIVITIGAVVIMSGSMRIADMDLSLVIARQANDFGLIIYILLWISLFGTMLVCVLGALELNPFSAAHAETEIVAGWKTELTGSDLAMSVLADAINLFNLAALIATIFLGGAKNIFRNIGWPLFESIMIFSYFLLQLLVILFFIAFLKTVLSRLRVDQSTEFLWKYVLPMSIVNLFVVILVYNFEV